MIDKTRELIESHPGKIILAGLFTAFVGYKGYGEYLSFSAEVQRAQADLRDASRQLCPAGVVSGALQVDCSDPDKLVVTIGGEGGREKKMYSVGGYSVPKKIWEGVCVIVLLWLMAVRNIQFKVILIVLRLHRKSGEN